MNARVVMSHDDIVAACADRLRAHGVTDFNEADISLEVASEEFHGQRKETRYKAIVDVRIAPRNAAAVPPRG